LVEPETKPWLEVRFVISILALSKYNASPMVKKKNPAAVALGKLGGKARAKTLSPEERSRIAELGAAARGKKLSAAERKRIAMMGVKARQAKRSKQQKGDA
jgi:hypothetical protein